MRLYASHLQPHLLNSGYTLGVSSLDQPSNGSAEQLYRFKFTFARPNGVRYENDEFSGFNQVANCFAQFSLLSQAAWEVASVLMTHSGKVGLWTKRYEQISEMLDAHWADLANLDPRKHYVRGLVYEGMEATIPFPVTEGNDLRIMHFANYGRFPEPHIDITMTHEYVAPVSVGYSTVFQCLIAPKIAAQFIRELSDLHADLAAQYEQYREVSRHLIDRHKDHEYLGSCAFDTISNVYRMSELQVSNVQIRADQ